MALDRSPSGANPALGQHRDLDHVPVPRRGHHRAPAPPAAWHSRATLAAVAAGATVAAGHTMASWEPRAESYGFTTLAAGALIQSSSAAPEEPAGTPVRNGSTRQLPDLAAMDNDTDIADVRSLTKAVRFGEELADGSSQIGAALAGGAPAASLFRGHQFVRPTTGIFTSGFGSRWGTMHYGVDIANRIGTPIYAVTDGTVIESGPASGFGMWIRVLHAGGWTSVYGHINRSLVTAGQKVRAGQKIAEMGNRGESTGPHLHLEIWDANMRKVNPLSWLAARGIRIIGLAVDPR